MGPPESIVLELKRWLSAQLFVETGTYQGGTAEWAGRNFRHVVTIEASEAFHVRAQKRLEYLRNTKVWLGDSRRVLSELIPTITVPSIFWLDAHWSGGETAGALDECPLLAELAILDTLPVEHAILVDDARCFLSPPPHPHNAEQWPDLRAAVTALVSQDKRYVAVFEDVFVAVPIRIRADLQQCLQELATATQPQRKVGFLQRLLGS